MVWILNEFSGQKKGEIIELLPMNDKGRSRALKEKKKTTLALFGSTAITFGDS